MEADHAVSHDEVARPDDEEPNGYSIDNLDISQSGEEQYGPYQELDASQQKVNGVEEPPCQTILIYLLWRLFHFYQNLMMITKYKFKVEEKMRSFFWHQHFVFLLFGFTVVSLLHEDSRDKETSATKSEERGPLISQIGILSYLFEKEERTCKIATSSYSCKEIYQYPTWIFLPNFFQSFILLTKRT